MSPLTALDHDNLSNRVYATLCDALIKGHFKPGDRLKIRDLAEQLGTSVTPVRDAILRLTQEDALVFQSARSIRLPVITRAQYLEIRTIRTRLEALAAEMAAQQASEWQILELEKLLAENEKAIAASDSILGAELNQAFHFQLTEIAGLPVLRGILKRLWLQMGPLISQVYRDGGRSMIDHHYAVVEAMRNHDGEAAARAIIADITEGGQALFEQVCAEEDREASQQ